MPQTVSEEIRRCYERAEDCARSAETAFDPDMRTIFLRLEQSYLTLARSYEFTQGLMALSNDANQTRDASHALILGNCTGTVRPLQDL
jgi:hypothetical protein